MNVLLLCPNSERLLRNSSGAVRPEFSDDGFIAWTDPIDPEFLRSREVGFVVSFGYRHIITRETIGAIEGRSCNVHISMLPWNRGADPNFWSWFDETPKGVSIHVMTAGLDTGPLLAQREVYLDDKLETLESSYEKLQAVAVELFAASWPSIRTGSLGQRQQQAGVGSYHRRSDKDAYWRSLPLGYKTRCCDVVFLGRKVRG